MILYDVVVTVAINTQMEKTVHLIFDLEMQRKYNMNYPLMNRAIYYVSRLIAKQDIKGAKYEDLVPVQSAWICIHGVPEELQNQCIHFEYQALVNLMNQKPALSSRALI